MTRPPADLRNRLTGWWRQVTPRVRPATPLPVAPAGTVAGYQLVRPLAHGAMGDLHLATDVRTGQFVALKTVRFSAHALSRERFLAESAAAIRLCHAHIVRTYASGVEGEGHKALGWMAMEWVDGHDLSQHAAVRQLPAARVLDIAAQVAEGLHHAHTHGVVHRDLKPANILLDQAARQAKISDFGCARVTDAERSRSGLLIGTLAYMAPEQILGGAVDGRCDLYALGVVLLQLLTGRLPFEAAAMGELLNQIASAHAPDLGAYRPDLPPQLSDIVARLLAKQPQYRHVDGAQLAQELRLVAAGMVPGAPDGQVEGEAQ